MMADRGGGALVMHFSVRTYYTFHYRAKTRKGVAPTASHYATLPFESMFTGLVAYDDLEKRLDSDTTTLYIDYAGNPELTHRVHTHLGDALLHSCAVGRTHITEASSGTPLPPLPGPKPAFFFIPTWKRAIAPLAPLAGTVHWALHVRVAGHWGWKRFCVDAV